MRAARSCSTPCPPCPTSSLLPTTHPPTKPCLPPPLSLSPSSDRRHDVHLPHRLRHEQVHQRSGGLLQRGAWPPPPCPWRWSCRCLHLPMLGQVLSTGGGWWGAHKLCAPVRVCVRPCILTHTRTHARPHPCTGMPMPLPHARAPAAAGRQVQPFGAAGGRPHGHGRGQHRLRLRHLAGLVLLLLGAQRNAAGEQGGKGAGGARGGDGTSCGRHLRNAMPCAVASYHGKGLA